MRHVFGHRLRRLPLLAKVHHSATARRTQQQLAAARRSPTLPALSAQQKPSVIAVARRSPTSPAQQQPSQKPATARCYSQSLPLLATARRCSQQPAVARNSPPSLPSFCLFAMKSFQNESAQEDVDDYSPLWKFVTKVEKAVEGGNVTWSCTICSKVCKGSYSRVKAHLLKQKGAGIAGCTAVTMDQMKRMQQLIDDAELRKKNSKQKEVPLPSSFASSNMASKSSFCSSGILQNDDPTKKRKGPLGPLEKSFNLNARDELHSEIASLATQRTIPNYLPPGYNLLRTSLLQKEKAHIGKLLEPTKAAWKQKGAINCEGEYKDKTFISKLLINTINEVGHQNVVQVVTDNAPVCKVVGLLVEAKYPHIFWTPCVVHRLNLALKNICAPTDSLQNKEAFDECKWIAEVANDASMIKNFIVNHNMGLSMFNHNSNLRMLSLADTRFASTIIMLKRFRQIKKCLENMVISERWDLYKEDDVVKARVVKYKILDDQFWEKIDYILAFTSPIYEMLRKTDTDQPCIIAMSGFKNLPIVFLLIGTLKFQVKGKKCIEKYYSNSSERRSVNEEFASFSAVIDNFSDNDSMRDRGLMSPTKWCYPWSPHYNEGESKMWDVGADGFDSMDMKGAAILEIVNLSLDESELESVLFTNEGGVGDETDMDV
ncbi:hypothetical protein ZIOFF_061043 [Zingiber officinale]|uniref:DUF659 domain-containing protein n=1 Tax=Zingiber officinale TaxID=94328 RepID=A0A8J5KPG1_ZINOF|nr:hypothetical protein ZIOFF_061043 [Zingiber officinale]